MILREPNRNWEPTNISEARLVNYCYRVNVSGVWEQHSREMMLSLITGMLDSMMQ